MKNKRLLSMVFFVAVTIPIVSLFANNSEARDPFSPTTSFKGEKATVASQFVPKSLRDLDPQNAIVTGVAIGKTKKIAILEDRATGAFFSVIVGSLVGRSGATITEIRIDAVVIEGQAGKRKNRIVLPLRRKGDTQ